MIEKIEVNENGDYKINYNGKIIKCNGVVEIYQLDEDLSDRLNPNIIDLLYSEECILTEYVAPVITLESVKQSKIFDLREQRDNVIDFNGIKIPISDIQRYMYLLIGTDTEIESRLPKKISNDFTITTIEQVKGLSLLLDQHNNYYDSKILECENATTIAEIEAI